MICRILEIVMLFLGIYAIAAGDMPSFLLGGADYKLKGRNARLLGLVLVLPILTSFALIPLLLIQFGEPAIEGLALLDLVIPIACVAAVVIIGRSVRQTAMFGNVNKDAVTEGLSTTDDLYKIEATIAKKAQGSLIYALLGILGFSAIVVCPLAFIRANQALRLIDKYHVGEQHRSAAKGARIIAPIIFVFYAAIAAFFVGSGIVGLLSGM